MAKFTEQIDGMQWSYSRISAFEDCPYRWFMRYLDGIEYKDMFYASYGTFIHKIIDGFYKGEYSQDELASVFISKFKDEVKGYRPKTSTVQKYLEAGIDYFRNFKPFPFKVVATELEIEYEICGIPFIGYIDYLGEEDGNLIIVDNKSRDLKPRSKRKKPTKHDEELDKYLVQLYLYSAGVEQRYGKTPKYLCFNCFKSQTFIKEPFLEEKYEEAKKWAVDNIEKIRAEEAFPPNPDFFKCRWICGMSGECDYKFVE